MKIHPVTNPDLKGGWRLSGPPGYSSVQRGLTGGCSCQSHSEKTQATRLVSESFHLPENVQPWPARGISLNTPPWEGGHVWDDSCLGRNPSVTGFGESKIAFTPETDWYHPLQENANLSINGKVGCVWIYERQKYYIQTYSNDTDGSVRGIWAAEQTLLFSSTHI